MKIYTDGSSRGNPGPGGFGVVVFDDEDNLLYAHSKMSEENTTNNEQELLAIVFAAAAYGRQTPPPQVYSDSSYAVNTLTDWMYRWKDNNWLRSNNSIPENLEIVKFYYALITEGGFKIDLHKIAGHSGNKGNDLADKLAKGQITPEAAVSEIKKERKAANCVFI